MTGDCHERFCESYRLKCLFDQPFRVPAASSAMGCTGGRQFVDLVFVQFADRDLQSVHFDVILCIGSDLVQDNDKGTMYADKQVPRQHFLCHTDGFLYAPAIGEGPERQSGLEVKVLSFLKVFNDSVSK